jgi:hypothetical protein
MLKGWPVGRVHVVCQLTVEAEAEISHKGHNSLLQVRFHLLCASISNLLVGLGGSEEESACKQRLANSKDQTNEVVTGW